MSYTHCSPYAYLLHVTNSRASLSSAASAAGVRNAACSRRTARRDTFTRARVKRLERHRQSKLAEDTFTGARKAADAGVHIEAKLWGSGPPAWWSALSRRLFKGGYHPAFMAWQPLGILRRTGPQGERPVVVTRSSTEVMFWRQWVLRLAPERET